LGAFLCLNLSMGILNTSWFNFNWGKDKLASDKSPQQTEVDPKLLDKVTALLAETVLPITGAGRQTVPDNKTVLQVLGDLILVQPGFDTEWLEALEILAMFHPDISAAVDNISLANTDFQTTFDDAVSDSIAKEMMQVLTERRETWYGYADGINGFIDDSLAQCAVTGAMSHEWIVGRRLEGVSHVSMVTPKNIMFHHDTVKGIYVPVQKIPNNAMYIGPTVMGQYKKLNTVTYRYSAMRRLGESPYAVPPFLAALENVTIQRNMVKNISKIIEKLGVLGFLKVMLNAPTRLQGETDKEYYAKCREAQESQSWALNQGLANSAMVGFKGVQEIEMQGTNQNVTGAEKLMDMNDRLLINGLKQPVEMLNRNGSTSETFGRVMLAKLGRSLGKYQTMAGGALAYGDLLHLQMMGYPVTKVFNTFEPVMLGDKSKEEEAYGKKIDNTVKLYNEGIISQLQKANQLGYEKPDQEEPRQSMQDKKLENDIKNVNDGVDLPKKTAAENGHAFKLSERLSKILAETRETGMGYHLVDLTTDKGVIKNVVVTNGTHAWTQEQLTKVESLVVKTRSEAVDFFVQRLSKDKPTYWGYEDAHQHHSGCTHHEEFGVPKNEKKFWNKYNKDVAEVWDKTTREIQEAIIQSLSQIEYGLTPEAMESNVLFNVFSKVDAVFIPQITPIVQKHVTEIYKYYRKSQTPWAAVAAGKKKIPDAVFNLIDIRAMEFFKNSDTLYLGKFVTDPDTRKRMTQFIKSNYIEQNTEVGRNAEGIEAFAKKFRSQLLDEDWKMRRIIDTSVNKMRNTAGVMYMQQAEVSEFTVVGVSDRLQCEFCAAMQGKVLSIQREVVKIERMVNSDPEDVPNISPFLTSLKIPAQQINEMKGDAIQDLGVGAPSYHPLCRDVVVVYIK
jgi:Ni,Fe-hydrogenase III component G